MNYAKTDWQLEKLRRLGCKSSASRFDVERKTKDRNDVKEGDLRMIIDKTEEWPRWRSTVNCKGSSRCKSGRPANDRGHERDTSAD